METKNVTIKHEGNHYAVYIDNVFYCTADTYYEAVKEVERGGYL